MMIDVIDFDDGICYTRLRVFVPDHTLNSSVNLQSEVKDGVKQFALEQELND